MLIYATKPLMAGIELMRARGLIPEVATGRHVEIN